MRFSDFPLSTELHRAVERMGFTEMTEIQQKALPVMLAGKDIIAKAPTGTGKTCAFGIPLLADLNRQANKPQALILAPTRELAQQITSDLRDLAHYMPEVRIACLYGGQAIGKQIDQLKQGAHIIVATPGRLLDHRQRRSVTLDAVTRVVLDEADEMLDMGFYKDVRRILDGLKNKRQLAMFSATISREVLDIAWYYQRDAEEIVVHPVEDSRPKIKQYALLTTGRNKLPDLAALIVGQKHERVMVFCNTRYITGMLSNQLARLNFLVDCLHGDLSQAERNKIMTNFKEGKLRVLVATDVAARGIDVEDVDAVFNYDLPTSNEYYTHRIGRTGRAQREGISYLFYTQEEERRMKEMLRLTRNITTRIQLENGSMVILEEDA